MEIMQVVGSLVCTQRVSGLDPLLFAGATHQQGENQCGRGSRWRLCGQLGVHSQRLSGPLCLPQP